MDEVEKVKARLVAMKRSRFAHAFPALLVLASLGGCSASTNAGASASTTPTTATTPTAATTPTVQPTEAATPSPKPTSTPILNTAAPGQPWHGIYWSDPVLTDLPFANNPFTFFDWQGRHLGISELDGHTTVVASTDWIHWTTLVSGLNAPSLEPTVSMGYEDGYRSLIAYSDTRLVVVGDDAGNSAMVSVSEDGANWSKIADESPFAGSSVTAITRGKDKFVAVGADTRGGVIWTSVDGSVWRKDASATYRDKSFSGVAATPYGYVLTGRTCTKRVAVDYGFTCEKPKAAAWISSDGLNWATAKVGLGDYGPIDAGLVRVAPRGLVAVGLKTGGECEWCDSPEFARWSSADGKSWTLRATQGDEPAVWGPFVGNTDRLIGEGFGDDGNPQLWETQDGVNWHEVPPTGYGSYTMTDDSLESYGSLASVDDQTIVTIRYELGTDTGATQGVYLVTGTGLR